LGGGGGVGCGAGWRGGEGGWGPVGAGVLVGGGGGGAGGGLCGGWGWGAVKTNTQKKSVKTKKQPKKKTKKQKQTLTKKKKHKPKRGGWGGVRGGGGGGGGGGLGGGVVFGSGGNNTQKKVVGVWVWCLGGLWGGCFCGPYGRLSNEPSFYNLQSQSPFFFFIHFPLSFSHPVPLFERTTTSPGLVGSHIQSFLSSSSSLSWFVLEPLRLLQLFISSCKLMRRSTRLSPSTTRSRSLSYPTLLPFFCENPCYRASMFSPPFLFFFTFPHLPVCVSLPIAWVLTTRPLSFP